MRPDPLRPSRPDLEAALAARHCPEPTDGLRRRLLAVVAAERRAVPPPTVLWRIAWGAAAAAVLAVNLAITGAAAARYHSLAEPAEPVSAIAGPAEDRFDTLAGSALARVRPAPDAGGLARRFFEQRED